MSSLFHYPLSEKRNNPKEDIFMKYTIASHMNKSERDRLVGAITKTDNVLYDIKYARRDIIIYDNKTASIQHASSICGDMMRFLSFTDDNISGNLLLIIDHVISSLESFCYEISNTFDEIPEELRDELKASMVGIREVFSMDHRR